jgi:hypothetical protein
MWKILERKSLVSKGFGKNPINLLSTLPNLFSTKRENLKYIKGFPIL